MIWLERLAFLGAFAGICILAFTGFGPLVFGTPPMSGYVLLAHVAIGAAFAVCALAFLAFRAESCKFGAPSRFGAAQKIMFWLMAASGLIALLSIMLSMTPLVSEIGISDLILIHRYSSLATALAFVGHILPGLVYKPKAQPERNGETK
jgi:hypothetical protein